MLKNIKIIFILALSLFSFDLKAQSLELVTSDVKVFAKPDIGYANCYATIKNKTNATVEVKVKCEPLKLEADHTVSFCLGDQSNGGICFPPSTGQIISTNKFGLAAGATSKKSEFNGLLNFNASGTSQTRYTFFNAINVDDKVSFEVTWIISPLGGVGEDELAKTLISLVNGQNDLVLNVPNYLINKSFNIFDANGRFIQNVNINSNQVNVSLSNFLTGTYFLRIDGIETSLKFNVLR